MVSCQSPWLHPKCDVACAYSLWPGRYVFPTTCSYRSARSNITIVPEWTTDGVYDLPRLLEKEETECMFQKAEFQAIGYETLLMSPEEKDAVMTNLTELCSAFANMAQDLRRYYADVNVFSESILQQPDTANAGAESRSATTPASRRYPVAQDMDDETVSSFFSHWNIEYNLLVSLGKAFASDIDLHRHVLNTLRIRVSEAREQAAGARHDVVNQWPFIRRVCNDVGLCPSEPPEIWRYHDTLEALDPWLTATSTQESLLARVWSNVTAIHEDLDAQMAARFSAEALSFFGPAPAVSVDSWLTEIRETAREPVVDQV
ncbi:MAG: hypothetical protein L6R36_000029 [Xanthoria steineri]|nr:MAG: hypothetical protein L6R36_000029 [Xanthoria steineri]